MKLSSVDVYIFPSRPICIALSPLVELGAEFALCIVRPQASDAGMCGEREVRNT